MNPITEKCRAERPRTDKEMLKTARQENRQLNRTIEVLRASGIITGTQIEAAKDLAKTIL